MVGPSVSTFYFDSSATGFPASVNTFFNAVKGNIPDDVSVSIANTGDLIDSSSGALTGVWTDTGGTTIAGTNAGGYLLGSGARINWVTAGVRDGRRVVGTTFMVPYCAATGTGVVDPTAVSTLQTAGSALVTAQATHMMIWGKPHTKAAADGVANAVVAAIARSLPTQLRSRRT